MPKDELLILTVETGILKFIEFRKQISEYPITPSTTLKKLNVPSGELHQAYAYKKKEGFKGDVIDYICYTCTRYVLHSIFLNINDPEVGPHHLLNHLRYLKKFNVVNPAIRLFIKNTQYFLDLFEVFADCFQINDKKTYQNLLVINMTTEYLVLLAEAGYCLNSSHLSPSYPPIIEN